MSNPQPGERKVKKPRTPRIPADKDSVWEDGSGDEARARRRDDVEGAIRLTADGRPAPDATKATARGSRPPITRSAGAAATKRKRKAARRLK